MGCENPGKKSGMTREILSLNIGSSSLKFALYSEQLEKLCEGNISKGSGLNDVFSQIEENSLPFPSAIGHRIVHGGELFTQPIELTKERVQKLETLIPLAPLHLPPEIALVKSLMGKARQVGCFDTAFHHTIPEKMLPLSQKLYDQGIKKYGFHGISYEYILTQLKESKKTIIAHLGNGSSMSAIKNGVCIDTSMSFTPSGGLMMGTRCGDLDPGICSYLLSNGYTKESLNHLINHESGLLGVSGISSDMKQLLEKKSEKAIDMYCAQIRKMIGSFIAVLGGLDLLVFTGGIGEKAAKIREKILSPLTCFGFSIDKEQNKKQSRIISDEKSSICVEIIPTDEEKMIAIHTKKVIYGK